LAGDVVYNQCHMYVGDTTPESGKNWVAALDRAGSAASQRLWLPVTRSLVRPAHRRRSRTLSAICWTLNRLQQTTASDGFRGYENWQVVAVSQTEDLLKVMVANPTMIDAYGPAFPATARLPPTVPRLQRSSGNRKRAQEAPFSVRAPDVLQDVFLIEKDTKRFPDTKGRRDGHTPYLTMSPRRTRSSPIRRAS